MPYITVRVTEAELAAAKALGEREDSPVSTVVRRALTRAIAAGTSMPPGTVAPPPSPAPELPAAMFTDYPSDVPAGGAPEVPLYQLAPWLHDLHARLNVVYTRERLEDLRRFYGLPETTPLLYVQRHDEVRRVLMQRDGLTIQEANVAATGAPAPPTKKKGRPTVPPPTAPADEPDGK